MSQARKVFLFTAVFVVLICPPGAVAQGQNVKISVFNYGALNMEASAYGTEVTNHLISSLRGNPSLSVLDRKELESFLSLNDLQQNDALDNAINIGGRLALDFIVAGTVGKKGSVITIKSKVFSIGQKRVVLYDQSKAYGDAELAVETRKISEQIIKTVLSEAGSRKDESASFVNAPVNIEARPGNMSVLLRWEDAPGERAAGYKIYRGLLEAGPFTRVAQVSQPEYLDQGLEKKTTYYYRIRAFDVRGIQSGESPVVKAETVPTPFAPIILKAEGHIKSVLLTWSANPRKSDDPIPLKGFKVYRSDVEKGPYKETANLALKDIGAGSGLPSDGALINHAVKGLADGKEYYFRVTAYNENNLESNFCDPFKASTTPGVQKISAQGEMIREIRLGWTPVDSSYLRGYWIYRSADEGKDFARLQKVETGASRDQINYTDIAELADKTRYSYRVTAFEEPEMETDPSPVASAVTKGKPPVPRGLQAVSGLVRKVQVIWTPNTEEDVEGYKLYRSRTERGKYELVKKISGRASGGVMDEGGLFGFRKLEDQGAYYYILTTYNKVDVESDNSAVVSGVTKFRPQKPTGVAGENQGKKVVLKWSRNPEPDVVSYTVYEKSPTGLRRVDTVKENGFSDAAPEGGKSRTYVVTAVDKDDIESEPSVEVTLNGI